MRKKKILLVDDSRFFIELEKNILIGGNYDFVEAHDGREALALVYSEKPDLVLLDINMPIVNGIQFLGTLRKREGIKETPVIVVTTKGKPTDVQEAFQAGANDYISKPIDNMSLQLKVQAQLDPLKVRVSPRLQVRIPLTFSDFESQYSGTATNISTGGIHFQCDQAVQLYQKIEIAFTLKHDDHERSFNLFGQVVSITNREHAVSGEPARFEIHVQFLNMNWEDFSFLDRLINADIGSVASFLLTSSNQRSGIELNGPMYVSESHSNLAAELDRILSSYAGSDVSAKQFEGKYSVLLKHLKDIQLDFRNLTISHSQLREHYVNVLIVHIVSKQLHLQHTFQGWLNTLSDMCENMLGADQFDIYALDSAQDCFFSLLTGRVLDERFVQSDLSKNLREGELFINPAPQTERSSPFLEPLALVPLIARKTVIGCIVIASLLPQRTSFSHVCLQLLDLLSKQAGQVLFACQCSPDSDQEQQPLKDFSASLRALRTKK
ncbi:response regulator [bacterium]|nr:response regulator [bacterium]